MYRLMVWCDRKKLRVYRWMLWCHTIHLYTLY